MKHQLCLSLFVFISVYCEEDDINKRELFNLPAGADCEWNGVKGKCVKETQCMTTLDTRGDKHLVCSKKGDVTIVCCTDCELVNSTRNVVLDPATGFHWKDGTKARDRADCEWNGVKGKCVKETQCMTTLDTRGDKHLVCSKKGDVTIVCCTDCELVNSTRNVVLDPTTGFYWKDGTKARDSCLEYLDTLPYKCREGGFYSGISKNFDEDKKCHKIGLWGIGGAPSPGSKSGAEYPHQAMLGYGKDLASAHWQTGGSIISNKYILTAAHVFRYGISGAFVKFVALGVEKRSDPPTAWQTHKVKRSIAHPDYRHPARYNDIGLIETETPITFNADVLPACLHVEAASAETAIAITWIDLKSASFEFADTLQTINLEQFTQEECKTAYAQLNLRLKDGIDYETQMCYGSKTNSPDACRRQSGEPLMITTQFSRCIYTIIGVASFGRSSSHCGSTTSSPDVYTRVAHYKPWIESIVWA